MGRRADSAWVGMKGLLGHRHTLGPDFYMLITPSWAFRLNSDQNSFIGPRSQALIYVLVCMPGGCVLHSCCYGIPHPEEKVTQ